MIPKNCLNNSVFCAADRKVSNPSIANTNRINLDQDGDSVNDYALDLSGNTTRDAQLRKFTYDAENKQTKVESTNASGTVTGTIGEYFYDGDGRRVKKRGWINGQWETTVFVYDASSRLVAEYSTILSETPQVAYLTIDHLGSPRINTNENGAVISRHDYHPFGEEIASGTDGRTTAQGYGGGDSIRQKFTGYERDIESELDFAKNRYQNFNLGRFQSPDPIIISRKRIRDPQIWNSYSYAGNNPLKYTDPDGLERIKLGDSEDKIKKDIEAQKAEKQRLEKEKKELKKSKADRADIDKKQGEIDAANKGLNTLNKKLEGTQTVNKMLKALDKVGERNGLKLSDFELSTDPYNDFSSLSEVRRNSIASAQAFTNVPNEGRTIFINTKNPIGFYQQINSPLNPNSADWVYYGASGLAHEQRHTTAPPGHAHSVAFQRQLDVFARFKNYYQSSTLYQTHLEEITNGANGNVP